MANNSPSDTSSSNWTQDVQGISGLWDLAWRASAQVAGVVKGAIDTRKSQKSVTIAQQSCLGEWSEGDWLTNDECKVPVITAERFRAYLEETDGYLLPPGECHATAHWVIFLHALGIGPHTEVMILGDGGSKKQALVSPPVPKQRIAMTEVRLECDGGTMCRIINLYSRHCYDGGQYLGGHHRRVLRTAIPADTFITQFGKVR